MTARARRFRLSPVVAAAFVVSLVACGPASEPVPDAAPGESRAFVATLGPASASASSHEPGLRYPGGTRVARIDGDAVTDLSAGFAAAGAPAVRHDGARVLFVARERDGEPFRVHECGPRGEDRREVVRAAGDCGGAAHLPDGRIVYSARTDDTPPAAGPGGAWALFVSAGTDAAPVRISWGGCDVDPSVLSDGRVLFSSWRATDADGRFVLCTVHPDGSGVAAFHAGEGSALRARQTESLDVQFLGVRDGDGDGDGGGAVAAVSWDVPSRRIDPPAALRTSAGGAEVLEAAPLAARPRPQGHLSSVRPEVGFSTLVAVDARVQGRGAAVRLSAGGVVLGTAALAPDGSFAARVPADAPLRIEVLDEGGAVVGADRGPFWLRPGESRVCVGCHDDVETGPPNVRPLALAGEPADLTSRREGVR